jgi:hypothetical protein
MKLSVPDHVFTALISLDGTRSNVPLGISTRVLVLSPRDVVAIELTMLMWYRSAETFEFAHLSPYA